MQWMVGLTLAGVVAVVQAQAPQARGELLYTTHCRGCHTTQVHWREKRLVSDWAGLIAQIERWQKNANLGWSGEEVDAVAHYLNGRFYRFPAPEGKPVGEDYRSIHVVRRD